VGKKPNRSYDQDGKADKTKAQQKKIQEQAREIDRLKRELQVLNKAFEKSAKYMSSQSKSMTVEELIQAADDGKTLEQAKTTKEDVRQRILDWRNKTYGKYEEE
jgi:uncharacterized membrane protein YdfJ with MMPL/SSD domain